MTGAPAVAETNVAYLTADTSRAVAISSLKA
jgi:hypothetical protein